jgi:hypothetical protein
MRTIPLIAVALTAAALAAAGGAAAHGAPTGAAAAAPQPIHGYEIVTGDPITVAAGAAAAASVPCPAGKRPLGGSVTIAKPTVTTTIASAYPRFHRWFAAVNNTGATTATFRLQAVCALPPPGYVILTNMRANASGRATARIRCPGDLVPLGGGAATTASGVGIDLNADNAQANPWVATATNLTGVRNRVVAVIVCARRPHGYTRNFSGFNTLPPHSVASETPDCPTATSQPLAGGVRASEDLDSVYVAGLELTGRGWRGSMANGSDQELLLRTSVTCADVD